jgi:hypothetical protein
MGRPALRQTSFAGGELSPLMLGRTDVESYLTGCRELVNFLPLPQGPAVRRPGTAYVAGLAGDGARGWLSRFVFSRSDAYVIEWAHQKLRLFAQGGRVMNGGSPFEIASPYTTSNLTDADGLFSLRFAQSGDQLYVVGAGRRPYLLQRNAALDWDFDYFTHTGGPWAAENGDDDITVHASAATGDAITLTASSGIFTPDHVNGLFRLFTPPDHNYDQWESSTDLEVGDVVQNGPNVYEATREARTGTVAPTHTRGTARDGDERRGDGFVNGVDWKYLHSGYGWVRITGFTSSTVVTAKVLSRLPDEVVGSGNATERWQFGAWSPAEGYPEAVAFFATRLVFARGRTLWFSAADDFGDFRDLSAGEVLADSAITITIGGTDVNEVEWLEDVGVGLAVGTDGGEYLIRRGSDGQVFGAVTDGARNVRCDRHTSYGCLGLQPATAHDRLLFVTRTGATLRELAFALETDKLRAADLSILAEHVLRAGVVAAAWQAEPDNLLWLALADGSLGALTFDPEQRLVGWSRHALGGSGFAESLAAIPAADGSGDELWLIVRRPVDGSTKRYVERLAARWAVGAAATASRHLDCHLVYEGSATSSLSGLSHLQGAAVGVLANGAVHPDATVVSGAVSLSRPATHAVVGLPYASGLVQLPAEAPPGSPEVLQGQKKRVSEVTLRLLDCGPVSVGSQASRLVAAVRRTSPVVMGQGPALFSGDVTRAVDSSWDDDGAGVVEVAGALPAVVQSITRRLDWGER